MSRTDTEVRSQPDTWRRGLSLTADARTALGPPGERVLFIGCGTSAFVSASLAALRESAGVGESDAAYASETLTLARPYDRVVALSRSGTTTEVIDALRAAHPAARRVGVVGVDGSALEDLVDERLLLDFADEQSVVQTRFPTTTLLLARAAFGADVAGLPAALEADLGHPAPTVEGVEHVVFLGHGWTRGLADEAALKVREAAQSWAESYPLLDYRHGPLAVAGPQSLVWVLGGAPLDLVEDVRATGATVVAEPPEHVDPLVDLVRAQRLALALAARRGLDPDHPRHLSRSVVLTGPGSNGERR